MKKIGKTREVLDSYKKGGMSLVSKYLSDENLDIKEDTWIYKAKRLLESKNILSLEVEIQYIINKFKLIKKNEIEKSEGTDS
jgi:hypothetical protein